MFWLATCVDSIDNCIATNDGGMTGGDKYLKTFGIRGKKSDTVVLDIGYGNILRNDSMFFEGQQIQKDPYGGFHYVTDETGDVLSRTHDDYQTIVKPWWSEQGKELVNGELVDKDDGHNFSVVFDTFGTDKRTNGYVCPEYIVAGDINLDKMNRDNDPCETPLHTKSAVG